MRKLILSVDELDQESEINMNNIHKMLQEKNILIKINIKNFNIILTKY